jgi:3-dehydroquinate synthetase
VITFIEALQRDKKNRDGEYGFILPLELGQVELQFLPIGEKIELTLKSYFLDYWKN